MMEFTGERFTPECEGEIRLEHLHRYRAVCPVVMGKVVLDVASGEGYGTALLGKYAKRVVGADVDPACIEHAVSRYGNYKVGFVTRSADDLGLETDYFDVVTSFETLEHLTTHDEMLSEMRRVLKADGLFIVSTPDKAIYSDLEGMDNPHHPKELYLPEFEALCRRHFSCVQILGQQLNLCSLLVPTDCPVVTNATIFRDRDRFVVVQAKYLIAICGESFGAVNEAMQVMTSAFVA